MFKYTIEAYDEDKNFGPVNHMEVLVTAETEQLAIARAKEVVVRQSYSVVRVEDPVQHSIVQVPTTEKAAKDRVGKNFTKKKK